MLGNITLVLFPWMKMKSLLAIRVLTDLDQLLGRGISNLKSAMDHLSIQQAVLGAQMSKAEVQRGALASRKLAVSKIYQN